MKLYYLDHKINVNMLENFIRDDVELVKIDRLNEMEPGNTLILSQQFPQSTAFCEKAIEMGVKVVYWEAIDSELYDYAEHIFGSGYYQYMHFYMYNSLKKALDPGTDTLMLGSSYGQMDFDIDLLMSTGANMGLTSQDAYYSCMIGKYVINHNPSIKRIILGTGYYFFYTDISRAKTASYLIDLVYDPLFGDRHHNTDKIKFKLEEYKQNDLFDMEKVCYWYSNQFFEKNNYSWFHKTLHRKELRNMIKTVENHKFEGDEVDWIDSSYEFKHFKGNYTATGHNKNLKHVESFKENQVYFQELVDLCNGKGVELYVCALPGTMYYSEFLSPQYKEDYYNVLENTKGDFDFIDLNGLGIFDDNDYIDADHMSEHGAEKVMMILNDIIYGLSE